jgi:hypothetical protein
MKIEYTISPDNSITHCADDVIQNSDRILEVTFIVTLLSELQACLDCRMHLNYFSFFDVTLYILLYL